MDLPPGAWIFVRIQGRTMARQAMPTRSYLSQSELPVTFGLGQADHVDELEIVWPDGQKQRNGPVPIDQQITIEQDRQSDPSK
jgi:hypothetical protein